MASFIPSFQSIGRDIDWQRSIVTACSVEPMYRETIVHDVSQSYICCTDMQVVAIGHAAYECVPLHAGLLMCILAALAAHDHAACISIIVKSIQEYNSQAQLKYD